MGTDIHGTIEIDRHAKYKDTSEPDYDPWWECVARVDSLLDRDYDAFGSLFGVRNNPGVDPVADTRGFPHNVTDKTKDAASYGHSRTHVYLDELFFEADWEELGDLDDRVSVFDANKQPTGHKFGYSSKLDERLDQWEKDALDRGGFISFENEDGEQRYYKCRRLRRIDTLGSSFEWFVFKHLPTYADRFGAENVRWIVWFDS